MQVWRSSQSREALIQHSETEKATIERAVFYTIYGIFLTTNLGVLYWTLERPAITAWTTLAQALAKAGS
jgi:hypothetical protein